MLSRFVLLACVALLAGLPGRVAVAQGEDTGTCSLWGLEPPGQDERGVRPGEIEPSGGWPRDEVGLYDKPSTSCCATTRRWAA